MTEFLRGVCMLYCNCKFMYVLVRVLLSIYCYVSVLFQQKDLIFQK